MFLFFPRFQNRLRDKPEPIVIIHAHKLAAI